MGSLQSSSGLISQAVGGEDMEDRLTTSNSYMK
jgi:hypothetical protein